MGIGDALRNLTDTMQQAGVQGRLVLYLEKPTDGSFFLNAAAKEIGDCMPIAQPCLPDSDGEHESIQFFGVKIRWPKRC